MHMHLGRVVTAREDRCVAKTGGFSCHKKESFKIMTFN
jgi:hypothetical protein